MNKRKSIKHDFPYPTEPDDNNAQITNKSLFFAVNRNDASCFHAIDILAGHCLATEWPNQLRIASDSHLILEPNFPFDIPAETGHNKMMHIRLNRTKYVFVPLNSVTSGQYPHISIAGNASISICIVKYCLK